MSNALLYKYPCNTARLGEFAQGKYKFPQSDIRLNISINVGEYIIDAIIPRTLVPFLLPSSPSNVCRPQLVARKQFDL